MRKTCNIAKLKLFSMILVFVSLADNWECRSHSLKQLSLDSFKQDRLKMITKQLNKMIKQSDWIKWLNKVIALVIKSLI